MMKEITIWNESPKPGDILVDADGNIGVFEGICGMCWHSKPYLGVNGVIYDGGSHLLEGTKYATEKQIEHFNEIKQEMKIDFDSTLSFGAFDSKLQRYEWYIPDGYSAEIIDDKVIVTKNKSEFETMQDETIHFLTNARSHYAGTEAIDKCIEWVESLKEPVQNIEPVQ